MIKSTQSAMKTKCCDSSKFVVVNKSKASSWKSGVKISNRFETFLKDDLMSITDGTNRKFEEGTRRDTKEQNISEIVEGNDNLSTKTDSQQLDENMESDVELQIESSTFKDDETPAMKIDIEEKIKKLDTFTSKQQSKTAEAFVKVKLRKVNPQIVTCEQKCAKVRGVYEDVLLKGFATPNPFNLLEDIDDECIEGIRLKTKIKSMPKRQLKKCKYCHHKKRSCSLSLSSCDALSKICRKCGKLGHYPKSICCKATKITQKVKPNNQHRSKDGCFSRKIKFQISKR